MAPQGWWRCLGLGTVVFEAKLIPLLAPALSLALLLEREGRGSLKTALPNGVLSCTPVKTHVVLWALGFPPVLSPESENRGCDRLRLRVAAGLSLGSLQRRTSGPEDPTRLPGKSCSRAAAVGDVNPLVKFTFPPTFV